MHELKSIKVWDLPIRIIHWSIVTLFIFLWWSAENDELDYHRYAGYGLAGILAFRVYWGIAGSTTARFSQFLKGPWSVWQYCRAIFKPQPSQKVGHNPLGGWSTVLLIVLLLIQIVLGLFAIDVDGWEAGPFNQYISFEMGRWCAEWHEIIFNILLGLIGVHIGAVVFYRIWHKQNLIKTMLTGKAPGTDDEEMTNAPKVQYIVASMIALLVFYYLLKA